MLLIATLMEEHRVLSCWLSAELCSCSQDGGGVRPPQAGRLAGLAHGWSTMSPLATCTAPVQLHAQLRHAPSRTHGISNAVINQINRVRASVDLRVVGFCERAGPV